jgi:Domain of unknown function (DUF5658)
MGVTRFHPGKFLLYSVLSVADLALTFFLVTHGRGHIYEGNPIANAWLSSFGWSGLILYKALTMSLLAGTLFFLSLYNRTRVAGRVLVFACLALSAVVGYSANIAYAVRAQQGHLLTQDDLESYRVYYFSEIAPATRLVRSGTWTLAEAADHLVACENEYWQTILRRRYPGLSDRESLEAFLKTCVGATPRPRTHATHVSHRVSRDIDS